MLGKCSGNCVPHCIWSYWALKLGGRRYGLCEKSADEGLEPVGVRVLRGEGGPLVA